MKASASHSVRGARAASSVEAAVSAVDAFASMESSATTAVLTGEAAVAGMRRPVVDAVIQVFVVVSFMMLPITKVPPIAKVVPIVVPVAKVVPIVVTEVIKIMVEVAEEENRREAHVKR